MPAACAEPGIVKVVVEEDSDIVEAVFGDIFVECGGFCFGDFEEGRELFVIFYSSFFLSFS